MKKKERKSVDCELPKSSQVLFDLMCWVQEIGKLTTMVVWPVDRLAKDLAAAAKEIVRLENQMKIAGSTRTMSNVGMDLDVLEGERGV